MSPSWNSYGPVNRDIDAAESQASLASSPEKRSFRRRSCWPFNRRVTALIITLLLVITLLAAGSSPPGRKHLKQAKVTAETFLHSSSLSSTKDTDATSGTAVDDAEEGKDEGDSLSGIDNDVDWDLFAYTQYVTDQNYLCNSVMLFETLDRLGSEADRVMMYPESMHFDQNDDSKVSELLIKAQDEYDVKLVPVQVQHRSSGDPTWADSYTKLLAFNQTEYSRVLNLDSDATILQPMDELFLLPSAPVAMPRAYWGTGRERQLSSQLMLVEPSEREFGRVQDAIKNASRDTYDMEIMNDLYYGSCMVLPHRPYDLLTGEFKGDEHEKYMGNKVEPWEPKKIIEEAKFLHFSDWPVPKPWIHSSESMLQNNAPKCSKSEDGGKEDCTSRNLWLGFYQDFAKRRKEVCGLELVGHSSNKAKRRPDRREPDLTARVLA